MSITQAEINYYKRKGLPASSQFRFEGDNLVAEDGRIIAPEESKTDVIKAFANDPATMGGRDRLYGHISRKYANISRRDVAAWLLADPAHAVHRPLRKAVTSRPILVQGPSKVAQVDLVDVHQIAGHNDRRKYILTYVDLYSKLVDARPLVNKNQGTVTAAMKSILDGLGEWRPSTIQSDRGSEFQTQFDAMLDEYGIRHIRSAAYNPTTQGQIERTNRTIKSALHEYFTRSGSKRWIEALPAVIENLNNTRHRATNYTPISIMSGEYNQPAVRKLNEDRVAKAAKPGQEFEVGDYVRIAVTAEAAVRRDKFRKRYTKNWSDEVFQIYAKSEPEAAGAQPQYLIKNLRTNRKWRKKYWSYQLQKAVKQEEQQEEEEEGEEEEEEEEAPEEPIRIEPAEPRRSQRGWVPSAEAMRYFAAR